jgi:hypothetical protein
LFFLVARLAESEDEAFARGIFLRMWGVGGGSSSLERRTSGKPFMRSEQGAVFCGYAGRPGLDSDGEMPLQSSQGRTTSLVTGSETK